MTNENPVRKGPGLMMSIPTRAGVDVYPSEEAGLITLTQTRMYGAGGEDVFLEVHVDDVDRLCEILKAVKASIAEEKKREAEQSNGMMVVQWD